MSNDSATLLATAILVVFFFVAGLLELLDDFAVKLFLFLCFIGIVANIIIVKSKEEH